MSVTFNSQWPQALVPTTCSQIRGSAWNAITTVSGSNFLHNKLAPMVNPATNNVPEKAEELNQQRVQLFAPEGEYQAELVKMNAADGTPLEGAFFSGSSNQSILFALGAGGRFEAIANPQDAAHDFVKFFREQFGKEINVLVINTRGIGSEDTPSVQGSALDYYAAWDFLESKGLSVLPWGHSLGFRYVVQAAAWKQQENPEANVNIVSDRSFDDIANEAGQSMGGGVVGALVGGAMNYAGLGGDVQAAWNSLQGSKLILVATEDKTVPYGTASFYKRIQANPVHTNATVIKLRGAENPHCRIYSQDEMQAIMAEVNPMLGRDSKPTLGTLAKPLVTKSQEAGHMEQEAGHRELAATVGALFLAIVFMKYVKS